jgi:hypothetical protein
MKDIFSTISQELGSYGIKVIDHNTCSFEHDGKRYKSKIQTKIFLLRKKYIENEKVLKELLEKSSQLLSNFQDYKITNEPVDQKSISLFIHTVKDLNKLVHLKMSVNPNFIDVCHFDNIKKALCRDYKSFPKDVITALPDYKIAIDFIYRRNCALFYIARLLKVIEKNKFDNFIIKEAKGIQGPWSNLDLPMLERVFEWDDIEEEVRGRDKDIRKQRRYEQGLEEYNTDKFQEGHYLREMRNEPYSWANRFTESPYPSLRPGTWR